MRTNSSTSKVLGKSDYTKLTHYPKREFSKLSPAQEASQQCLGFSDLKQ
jgi:hypothetical protein